jgi:hypothetical protein
MNVSNNYFEPMHVSIVALTAPRDFKPNVGNADKVPFLIWIIVEIATPLSRLFCANNYQSVVSLKCLKRRQIDIHGFVDCPA